MKTYLINLAKSSARLERMTALLGALEIPFERFDAIDSSAALAHPLLSRIPRPRHRGWSPSELGCLLSHREVWARVASGDELHGAVLEDDLYVAPALKQFLSASLEGDFDLIKFETHATPTGYRSIPRTTIAGVGLHRLFGMHTGTGGYAISRRAAQILLLRTKHYDQPVDHLLFDPYHQASFRISKYQCVPGLVIQDDALDPAQRRGGAMATTMSDRPPFHAPPRTLMDRLARFPRSGARRVERLLFPITEGRIAFAGSISH
jgi:glycosyl transferase family 25